MDFVVYCSVASWDNYTRRPHYEVIEKYDNGSLIIVLDPVNLIKKLIRLFKNGNNKRAAVKNNVVQIKTLFPYRIILKHKCLTSFYQYRIDRKIGEKLKGNDVRVNIFTDASYSVFIKGKCKGMVNCFDLTDASWTVDLYDESKKKVLRESNMLMSQKSDLVFCTSNNLRLFAGQFNENSFYLRNTYEELDQRERRSIKPDIDIGYIGSINDWIDLELIEYALQNIDKEFVFIGRINGDDEFIFRFDSILNKYKNIRYMDPVSQKDLYKVIARFRTAIIPYNKNEFMSYVNPNKFYQYLSMLKPIVLTRFNPDFDEYHNMVYISDTKEEFVKHLNVILNCGDYKKDKRTYKNEDNFSRFKERVKIINSYLGQAEL